jgi:hypothetical protein
MVVVVSGDEGFDFGKAELAGNHAGQKGIAHRR